MDGLLAEHRVYEAIAKDVITLLIGHRLIEPMCCVDVKHDIVFVESSAAVEQVAALLRDKVPKYRKLELGNRLGNRTR